MNKQGSKGKGRGIEWTQYTWNVIRGCQHACRWTMPDGTVAVCYAETIANNVAQNAYPHGFEHHYWNPQVLEEPLKLREPSRIFLDSMSDLMGAWVPDEQIHAVLDVCKRAHWHSFQLLTKNAPRLEQFDFPANVWVGVSAPPTQMFGKSLTLDQQKRLVERQLRALSLVRGAGVRWMSIEPLSFDIAPLLVNAPLDWVVIGAATNGMRTYQPKREWVENVLAVMDEQHIPVFFKGNLQWDAWREAYPTPKPPHIAPISDESACGVLVSGRFEMFRWLHTDNRIALGLMCDTVTDDKRYTLTMPNQPVRVLTVKQATALLATGEFTAVHIETPNGRVVHHVEKTA